MDFITTVASIGLALVLLCSMGFALYASAATTAAERRVQVALRLSVRYTNARFLVGAEESFERKYRLEPGAEVAAGHAAAARDLAAILRSVAADAPRANAAEAAGLLLLHREYLAGTHRMFAAVDAKDPALALSIDHDAIDPIFARIQSRVDARAAEQFGFARAAFAALAATQQYIVRVAITFSVLGLTCLLGFLFVIYAYRRRLIAGHAAALRRMETSMLVDSLTQIGNHRAFKDDIRGSTALAVRHGLPLTLAVLDIDDFRQVNDQHGHRHGDQVLVELAGILSGGRASDRAYRLGGDEFALILPHTAAADAQAVLERVRLTAAEALHGSTVSIGYSTVERFDTTAESLQHQADAALYSTKRGGRNGVSRFDPSHQGSRLISTERVSSLRALLASGTMPIAFQPIWDLQRAEIVAFEALSRPAAAYGFAGPQDAFDLAERTGFAHELDRISWTSALRRGRDLPDSSLLFVNMSPQTLDRDFDVAAFAAEVARCGLLPERVVIELTERSIAHIDNVIAVARSLQVAGFGIALDDTGAGHAGLEIMSRLCFDYVKIDREIIVKAMSDRSARGVVAAIVAFAQITGAYVIAEGIEDVATLSFVDVAGRGRAAGTRGISGAQGYLLRRPSEALPSPSETREVSALLAGHVPAGVAA